LTLLTKLDYKKNQRVSMCRHSLSNYDREVCMKAFFCRLISQLLILSLATLPFAANAGMVGTDAVISSAQAQADREKVLDFMARAEVQKQFQALGLNPDTAKERVNALTSEEAQQIAGKIDSLPAGAYSGWEIVGILAVAFVIIWVLWK
jgi:hypothetical protein